MPSRFLFVAIPYQGHFGPMLAPATLLKEQGHTVSFASFESARGAIEKAGMEFVSLGEDPFKPDEISPLLKVIFSTKTRPHDRAKARAVLFPGMEKGQAKALLEVLKKEAAMPDVLVSDMLTWGAFDVAELLKLPLVLIGTSPLSFGLDVSGYGNYNRPAHVPFEAHSLAYPEKMSWLQRNVLSPCHKRNTSVFMDHSVMVPARNAVRAELGLPPLEGGCASVQTAAVPRSKLLLGISWDLEVEREIPSGVHLVGPMGCDFSKNFPPPLEDGEFKGFLDAAQEAGEAVVYVAMGTVVTLTQQQVSDMTAAFAAVPNCRFLWSVKEDQQAHLPADLDATRIKVVAWAPQAAVLGHPAVKVFISHGGLNSTNEGLGAGKPVLCMPFGADQPVNAQHIENKEVGLQMDPNFIKSVPLTKNILRLLHEPVFAQKAAALGEAMRSRASGAVTAAQIIAEFAAAKE